MTTLELRTSIAADLSGQNVVDMLNSGWRDYEDATQHRSAIDEQADCIVTRNKKDFKASTLPVLPRQRTR